MNNSLFVLGIVAFASAGVSAVFTTTSTITGPLGLLTNTATQAPYAYLALPLAAVGAVLVVVSLAVKEHVTAHLESVQ